MPFTTSAMRLATQAAHREPRDRRRREQGQHAHGLRYAELHRAPRQALQQEQRQPTWRRHRWRRPCPPARRSALRERGAAKADAAAVGAEAPVRCGAGSRRGGRRPGSGCGCFGGSLARHGLRKAAARCGNELRKRRDGRGGARRRRTQRVVAGAAVAGPFGRRRRSAGSPSRKDCSCAPLLVCTRLEAASARGSRTSRECRANGANALAPVRRQPRPPKTLAEASIPTGAAVCLSPCRKGRPARARTASGKAHVPATSAGESAAADALGVTIARRNVSATSHKGASPASAASSSSLRRLGRRPGRTTIPALRWRRSRLSSGPPPAAGGGHAGLAEARRRPPSPARRRTRMPGSPSGLATATEERLTATGERFSIRYPPGATTVPSAMMAQASLRRDADGDHRDRRGRARRAPR